MGEHVGKSHQCRFAVGVLRVVALDHARDRLREAPAPGENAADERVVDPELAALGLDPLLGRTGLRMHLARITGVGVHEHKLADVVQERGDQQAVTRLIADLAGEAVRRPLRGDGVEAEALGDPLPDGGALEEIKRPRPAGNCVYGARREQLDPADRALNASAVGSVDVVGEAEHGDRKRDIGLDRRDYLGSRRLSRLEQTQHAGAGLRQHRERLECLERCRQPPPVTFVVAALVGGVGARAGGGHAGQRRHVRSLALFGRGVREREGRPRLAEFALRLVYRQIFYAGSGLSQPARSRALSIRASVSSRPSSVTLSKIPGDTVVPAIATRTG